MADGYADEVDVTRDVEGLLDPDAYIVGSGRCMTSIMGQSKSWWRRTAVHRYAMYLEPVADQ